MRRDLRPAAWTAWSINGRGGTVGWNEIDKLIAWSALVKVLDQMYSSDEGRPSYPLLTYVKLLLLQQWYGLSDPGLAQAVDDRLSFRCRSPRPSDRRFD